MLRRRSGMVRVSRLPLPVKDTAKSVYHPGNCRRDRLRRHSLFGHRVALYGCNAMENRLERLLRLPRYLSGESLIANGGFR